MPPGKNNYLTEIIETLSEYNVDFIICGGVAVVLHGIERMTMDLDISVDMTEDNLRRLLKAMEKLQLVPRAPVPAEYLLDPEKRDMIVREKNAIVFTFIDVNNPYKQVDVFLTKDLSFDSLKDDAEVINISNCAAKLISKKALLKMKKAVNPPRDKDTFDIQALEKIKDDVK